MADRTWRPSSRRALKRNLNASPVCRARRSAQLRRPGFGRAFFAWGRVNGFAPAKPISRVGPGPAIRSGMIETTFKPKEVEPIWSKAWEDSGAFKPKSDPKADPFCIVIPPPNVTGSLHIGHALNNTLQDVLVRFERLRGKSVLWQPGTDHAGIATQMVWSASWRRPVGTRTGARSGVKNS